MAGWAALGDSMSKPGQDEISSSSGHRLFFSQKRDRTFQAQVFKVFGEFIATKLTVKIQCFGIVQMLIPFLGSDALFLRLVVFE